VRQARFIIAAAKGNFRIKSVMHGWWKTAGKIYEERKTAAAGRKGLQQQRHTVIPFLL